MDATMMPHVLSRLDAIREHQIRDGEMLGEIRYMLRQTPPLPANSTPSSPPASIPMTAPAALLLRIEGWISKLKPVGMVAAAMSRHAINAMVIVYMARGGSLGPIEPYVRYLLGMG